MAVDQSDGHRRANAPHLSSAADACGCVSAISRGAAIVRVECSLDHGDRVLSHPIIIFAAIDVRPSAFATLALNASILALVHLRHNISNWLAAVFGLLAASVVEFQMLFAAILPALVVCFIAGKAADRKVLWRQLSIALLVFAIASGPAVPDSKP
jgi:hypothetical protein